MKHLGRDKVNYPHIKIWLNSQIVIFISILIGCLVFNFAGCVSKNNMSPEVKKYILELKNNSVEVRKNAVIWLGNKKEISAVPSLIRALKIEKDKNTKYWIIHYLGKIGDKSVVPILIKIFKDNKEEIDIRLVAGHSLGLIGDKFAIPVLLKALYGFNPLQVTAAYALGEIGDESVVSVLEDILQEEKYCAKNGGYNASVPEAIKEAIKKIKFRRTLPTAIELLKNADILLKEAKKYQEEEKYEESINKWEEYLKLYDEKLRNIEHCEIPSKFSEYHYVLNVQWQAFLNIAKCYENLELYEKAIETYKENIKKSWAHSSYYKYRIRFLQENKDRERKPLKLLLQAERKIGTEKLEILKTLIKMYPMSSLIDEAYFMMAESTQNINNAIKIYKTSVDSYSYANLADDAQFMIGSLYERNGKWQKSIEQYAIVVEKFPKQKSDFLYLRKIYGEPWTETQTGAIAQFMIGQTYQDKKEYQKAITSYQKVIRYYPMSPFAPSSMHYIARCYEELKNYNLAAKNYEKLGDAFPKENCGLWLSWEEGGGPIGGVASYDMAIDIYTNKLNDNINAERIRRKIVE